MKRSDTTKAVEPFSTGAPAVRPESTVTVEPSAPPETPSGARTKPRNGQKGKSANQPAHTADRHAADDAHQVNRVDTVEANMAKSEPVKRADVAPDVDSVSMSGVSSATVATATAAPAAAPDLFDDLANLRLSQAFAETGGVKKLLRTVPVRKPHPQDFIRVHPDPAFRENFPIIELKEEREEYLVAPMLVPELAGEFTSKTLFTAINRQGVLFLLPTPLPKADGRPSEWHRSMREAAELAMGKWVRVKANMALGAYEIFIAESVMVEPEWPDVSFSEILRLAFRERVIDRFDHPVLKRLRGLA
jgi:hypothetical protein